MQPVVVRPISGLPRYVAVAYSWPGWSLVQGGAVARAFDAERCAARMLPEPPRRIGAN